MDLSNAQSGVKKAVVKVNVIPPLARRDATCTSCGCQDRGQRSVLAHPNRVLYSASRLGRPRCPNGLRNARSRHSESAKVCRSTLTADCMQGTLVYEMRSATCAPLHTGAVFRHTRHIPALKWRVAGPGAPTACTQATPQPTTTSTRNVCDFF